LLRFISAKWWQLGWLAIKRAMARVTRAMAMAMKRAMATATIAMAMAT
jgi:hypothetical protein